MSVGGKVVEVLYLSKEKVWVNTLDGRDYCAVYCDPLGESVMPGDSLWWSGQTCYWTPWISHVPMFD